MTAAEFVKSWPRPSGERIPVLHDTNEVSMRTSEALDEIWWQGRQWAVTSYGIECRDGTYCIDAAPLHEHHLADSRTLAWSWPAQVALKEWCDAEDFCTAYLVALSLHPRPKIGTISAARARDACFKTLGRRRDQDLALAADRARREREDAIRATYWTLDDIENLDLKEPAADA